MSWLIQTLSSFLPLILRVSLQAGVLTIMIIAIHALMRNKLNPRWRYFLWMLLLLRLVMPWTIESNISIYNLLPHSDPIANKGQSTLSTMINEAEEESTTVQIDIEYSNALSQSPVSAHQKSFSEKAMGAMPFIWLMGALAIASSVIIQRFRLSNLHGKRPLTDQKILDILEDCKEEVGVRVYLAVVESDRVRSPSLYGFIRPRLLLPRGAVESLGPERPQACLSA